MSDTNHTKSHRTTVLQILTVTKNVKRTTRNRCRTPYLRKLHARHTEGAASLRRQPRNHGSRSGHRHPLRIPLADQPGQLVPLTRGAQSSRLHRNPRHRLPLVGVAARTPLSHSPLALFVRDEVGAHRSHSVIVYAPARLRQSGRRIMRGFLAALGEEGPCPVGVGAPCPIVALHPRRFRVRGRGRGVRGLPARRGHAPFQRCRTCGRSGPCSHDGREHSAHGPPHTAGPALSAPSVPTRTMTHRSSSWLIQVGDHASNGVASPFEAASFFFSFFFAVPGRLSVRGGCQWPHRVVRPREAALPHPVVTDLR
jgi:hypothetical protein